MSRDHAEIVQVDDTHVVRDRGSRFGTFVNDEAVREHALRHGDRVRLGRDVELVFLVGEVEPSVDRATLTALGDLRQVATLLEGLSALGSGRVLEGIVKLRPWLAE